MKKLIIAAALICAAIISQAASIEWNMCTFDTIVDPDGNNFTGTATLACADLGWSDTVNVSGGDFDEYFTFRAREFPAQRWPVRDSA